LKVMARITIIKFVIIFLISMTGSAWPAVYYVEPDGNDNNNGSLKLPFATIQKAIDDADGGKPDKYDVIHVAKGTYVTGPIVFNNDNQKIVFEKDTLVLARSNDDPVKPNAFLYTHTRLFSANGRSNITIEGNESTFQMRKEEYLKLPPKGHTNQRHIIILNGCTNIRISGLTLKDAGGDGILVWGSKNYEQAYCKNIVIEDVNFVNNNRAGIQVGSVDGLSIHNCVFSGVPRGGEGAGLHFEPDHNYDRLANIIVRDTQFENNNGTDLVIGFHNLRSSSDVPVLQDVSMLFENITITGSVAFKGYKHGISITYLYDDGPNGFVRFKNVTVDNKIVPTSIYAKSYFKARVSFENCIWKNTPLNHNNAVILIGGGPNYGGIDFINCQVFDSEDRPAIRFKGKNLYDVKGDIYIQNAIRKGSLCDWGSTKRHNIGLQLHAGIADFCKEQVKP